MAEPVFDDLPAPAPFSGKLRWALKTSDRGPGSAVAQAMLTTII
jgi:hypothetical protein